MPISMRLLTVIQWAIGAYLVLLGAMGMGITLHMPLFDAIIYPNYYPNYYPHDWTYWPLILMISPILRVMSYITPNYSFFLSLLSIALLIAGSYLIFHRTQQMKRIPMGYSIQVIMGGYLVLSAMMGIFMLMIGGGQHSTLTHGAALILSPPVLGMAWILSYMGICEFYLSFWVLGVLTIVGGSFLIFWNWPRVPS